MPSYPCPGTLCTSYVSRRGDYCPEHAAKAKVKNERHRHYDQHHRNRDAKAFYNSAAWERARARKLAADPVCQECKRVFADTVHHKVPLERCTTAERTAQTNLMSLCAPCHGIVEARAKEAA